MKSERITILGTAEFKGFLTTEAQRAGLSVSELVRRRCEGRPDEDAALVQALARELHQAVAEARQSLQEGLAAVQDALNQRGQP